MPLIISRTTDVIVVNATPYVSALDLKLQLGSHVTDLHEYGLVFTYIAGQLSSNRQVTPALNRSIYIYAFGPLPQRIVLGGIMFFNYCNDNGEVVTGNPLVALDAISAYMVHNSIQPVIVTLQGLRITGFIDQVKYIFKDPDSRIGGFLILMTGIPSED